MYRFKKHIALFSLFVLLIPSVIQFQHAFKNHESTVCTSTDDYHFHEQKLDCSLLHYQHHFFSYTTVSSYVVVPQHFYKISYDEQPQVNLVVNSDKKATRGSPYFTV